MKILHILPSIRSGGVANVVYNLASDQRIRGESVDLYVSRPQKEFRAMENDFKSLNINIIFSKLNKRHDLRHILEIKKLLSKYDIVHVHLFPDQLWASLAYYSIPKLKRPILITTEHNTYNNRRKYGFLRFFDRFMYSSYDRIINIGNQSKIKFDNWLNSEKIKGKSILISNGVDTNAITFAPPADISSLNIPEGSKLVIMVARLTHPKDPITLVKAISHSPIYIHAIFVGYGPLEEKIKDLADTLNIRNRIHPLGLRKDVPSLLKSADLGVLSTYWDGFGLVAVEYMAAGLPVIASDVDGLKDVVGRKDCLFKTEDYMSLARKITHILSNDALHKQLSEFFLNRSKLYDVKITQKKYYLCYKNLLTQKKHIL